MGYTNFTKQLVKPYLRDIQTVCDLGAQNDYSYPLPAPYISEWYSDKEYSCIDLNGENGAYTNDLSVLQNFSIRQVDLVCDIGTSEHVAPNGQFSWEAIYNCWQNKHDLLKVGGVMVNENPKTGNWPLHGFNYYSKEFYSAFAAKSGYRILEMGEVPAMGNDVDGWNVYCVLLKISDKFPTLLQFKKLPLERN